MLTQKRTVYCNPMNFCFQCDRKLLKDSSFNGDAYLEVKSQPLQRKCSFGFNFQTYLANGVLLLSTFYGQSARDDLGMVSHTMSIITFFGHKQFLLKLIFIMKNIGSSFLN